MSDEYQSRRKFLKMVLATAPVLAFDWSVFPVGSFAADTEDDNWDVIVIGSGLGGLSAAAAFARQGFRALVLERHNRPGGYATVFKRPGGFQFDVSLHSTSVPETDGRRHIQGFPDITDVEFVPHPSTFRGIFPDYDITCPQCNPQGYIDQLKKLFPSEATGIDSVFETMRGINVDIGKLQDAKGEINYGTFPFEYPYLFKAYSQPWGQIIDALVTDIKLRSIINAQWGYYGLPPSKLSSIYYALPFMGYLETGGYYPKGGSQVISDAFVSYIEERGGKVMLSTAVDKILIKDGAAYGVRTAEGKEYTARAVISNVNVPDTFNKLMTPGEELTEYLNKISGYSVSLSSFQIWLGLKDDLVGKLGLKDAEIFYQNSYDHEASFKALVEGRIEDEGGYGLTLYDNLYEGYSPKGKNTINIITLMGYDHWKKYESDYFAGNKDAYDADKERIADILIDRVEKTLIPGLREAIEVKEIGTPLTNVRYTGNYRGGIYGWDQTLNNAMPNRLPQTTPIKNLYLSSAWTQPGGGYGGVIRSGLNCFGKVMKAWG
ncbi:MAG TPA: NAD(P)/FAD-dependent oxidoreductase [candidate division Zixibacteria bacterium]|nr:NAD(P)/FAD-dependent oxidoreductase [candidate division Zixibacteria bacterium]